MNYQTANAKLTGRCVNRRKLGNNTYLVRKGATGTVISVKLHATDIITFYENGDVELNSGGWRTVTTKARINEYLERFVVWQVKGVWYVATGGSYSSWHKIGTFEDGMVIHSDGTVTGMGELSDGSEALKLRRRVQKYAKDYVTALKAGKVPAPSNGDCWGCLMKADNGKNPLGGKDHILEHIKEKYYVPSLLVRAFETMPVSQVMKWAVAEKWYPEQATGNGNPVTESVKGNGQWLDTFVGQQIAKTISRYMLREVGQAS